MPSTPNRRRSQQHSCDFFIGSSPMPPPPPPVTTTTKAAGAGSGSSMMPFSDTVGFVGIDDSNDSFLMLQLGASPVPVAAAATSASALPKAPTFDDSDAVDWDLARLRQGDDEDDDVDEAEGGKSNRGAGAAAAFRSSPSEPARSSAPDASGSELSRMASAPPPQPPSTSSGGSRSRGAFKRPSPMVSTTTTPPAPATAGTPKRRRLASAKPLGDLTNTTTTTPSSSAGPCLHRCSSELAPPGCHGNKHQKRSGELLYSARVDNAIDSIDSLNLIGNSEQKHSLPTVKELNFGIRYVTGATVSHLVNGGFAGTVPSYAIIDCRYPYEYLGGHIQGARNIYTQEDLLKQVLEPACSGGPAQSSALRQAPAPVLIFHCEFSSERAPKLARFLRQRDREINLANYPELYFPEVYVLQGGYKSFFESHKSDCWPESYVKMADPEFQVQLSQFQRSSKAWERQNSRSRHNQRTAVDRFF